MHSQCFLVHNFGFTGSLCVCVCVCVCVCWGGSFRILSFCVTCICCYTSMTLKFSRGRQSEPSVCSDFISDFSCVVDVKIVFSWKQHRGSFSPSGRPSVTWGNLVYEVWSAVCRNDRLSGVASECAACRKLRSLVPWRDEPTFSGR